MMKYQNVEISWDVDIRNKYFTTFQTIFDKSTLFY